MPYFLSQELAPLKQDPVENFGAHEAIISMRPQREWSASTKRKQRPESKEHRLKPYEGWKNERYKCALPRGTRVR
jgi:hypothetical protein